MIAVGDTGFVVALLNSRDRWHSACRSIYQKSTRIYLAQPMLAEMIFMIEREAGRQKSINFLSGLGRSKYAAVAFDDENMQRLVTVYKQYSNTRLDFADLSVAVLAEHLSISQIFTIDHTDFSILRPSHVDHFELLPAQP